MIPANTPSIVDFLGTANLNTYDYPFRVIRDQDIAIKIYQENDYKVSFDLELNTDFTYVKYPFPRLGGDITLIDNGKPYLTGGFLGTNYRIFISFVAQPDQLTAFQLLNNQTPNQIEQAVDRTIMEVIAINSDVKRSLKIHEGDRNENINMSLPKVEGNAKKVLIVNEDEDGFDFGPTTDSIFEAAEQASNAAAAAETARDEAVTAKNAAEDAQEAAETAQEAAEEAQVGAEEAEAQASFWTNLFLFDNYSMVSESSSPIAVGVLDNSTMFIADDTDGDIRFDLPPLMDVDEKWKIAVIKNKDSGNVLTIYPDGADTIKGLPSFVSGVQGVGIVFYKETETNWGAKFFAFAESTGMSSLPMGGSIGAALVKRTAADYDAEWDDFTISGFSNRFGQAWSSSGLRDTILKILNIVYAGPLIASFTGTSNTLREKGVVVSSVTLTVNVTKRTNNIARILFTQGVTTIEDMNPPVNTGSGNSSTVYSTPFSDTITFTVAVTDETTVDGGPTTVSANLTYNFVYPYYYGAAAPGRTAAQVASLTKDVINSNANLTRNFTTVNGDVYYFAYPAAYGALTSIKDVNGFEVLPSFTQRTENITGLDGNPVSYYIYEGNNTQVAGTTSFTFIR